MACNWNKKEGEGKEKINKRRPLCARIREMVGKEEKLEWGKKVTRPEGKSMY